MGKNTRDLSIAGMYIHLTDLCVLLRRIDLKVQDISLIGASQLSASPVRIACSTLNLVDSTSQIVGQDAALVEINATQSMQIGGTIHSNAGVHLACKGRHCWLDVSQDGAVTVGSDLYSN